MRTLQAMTTSREKGPRRPGAPNTAHLPARGVRREGGEDRRAPDVAAPRLKGCPPSPAYDGCTPATITEESGHEQRRHHDPARRDRSDAISAFRACDSHASGDSAHGSGQPCCADARPSSDLRRATHRTTAATGGSDGSRSEAARSPEEGGRSGRVTAHPWLSSQALTCAGLADLSAVSSSCRARLIARNSEMVASRMGASCGEGGGGAVVGGGWRFIKVDPLRASKPKQRLADAVPRLWRTAVRQTTNRGLVHTDLTRYLLLTEAERLQPCNRGRPFDALLHKSA